MLFLSQITILHIFDHFGDHTTKKKKICHKLQPNLNMKTHEVLKFLKIKQTNFSNIWIS